MTCIEEQVEFWKKRAIRAEMSAADLAIDQIKLLNERIFELENQLKAATNALKSIRQRTIFGPALTTDALLDITALAAPVHDPTNPFAPREDLKNS